LELATAISQTVMLTDSGATITLAFNKSQRATGH